MGVDSGRARARHVEHLVECRQQQPLGAGGLGQVRESDGVAPELPLQVDGVGQLFARRLYVGELSMRLDPGIEVLPERFAKGRLGLGWEKVETKVGGSDRVAF